MHWRIWSHRLLSHPPPTPRPPYRRPLPRSAPIWPIQSLHKGDALAQPCANAVTAEKLAEYYRLLYATLVKHGLLNSANCSFNMNESGFPLDHKPQKVVALKGAKKVHCCTSGNKAQLQFWPVLMLPVM